MRSNIINYFLECHLLIPELLMRKCVITCCKIDLGRTFMPQCLLHNAGSNGQTDRHIAGKVHQSANDSVRTFKAFTHILTHNVCLSIYTIAKTYPDRVSQTNQLKRYLLQNHLYQRTTIIFLLKQSIDTLHPTILHNFWPEL